MKLYAIHDVIAGKFSKIFVMLNDEMAKRAMKMLVQNAEDPVAQSPGDYAIYRVGYYDDTSGIIEPEGVPYRVWTGLEAVEASRQIQTPEVPAGESDNEAES